MLGRSVIAVLLLSSFATIASAAPRRFELEPETSRVVIHVGKTGVFGFAGHDHEVVAPIEHASVVIDPDHLESASVELTFQAAALRVTGRGEPAGDVPKVQEAMVGVACLDARRFPTIRFVSRAVTVKRDTEGALDLAVRGDLDLHGVSRELLVPVHAVLDGPSVDATGTTEIRQTTFGIQPISVGGVVKVKDEIRIEWHLVARASS